MVNKKIVIVSIMLCIILSQLMVIIDLMNKEPEIVVKEVVKEVEVPKRIEVVKEVMVETEPQYVYEVTSEEREMLARLVYREANLESIECQKAIISVVINRWKNGQWGNTLSDVVYAMHQFSPANLIYKTTPKETNYRAVDEVLRCGTTIPKHVMYFRADYHFDWSGYAPYTVIDQTYFGYFVKDNID